MSGADAGSRNQHDGSGQNHTFNLVIFDDWGWAGRRHGSSWAVNGTLPRS